MSFAFAHPLLGTDSPLSEADQVLLAQLMTEEQTTSVTSPRWDWISAARALESLPNKVAAVLAQSGPTLGGPLRRRFRKTYLVGAGTALSAAQGLRPLFEEMLAGTPCEPIDSTDFAYYARQAVDSDCLVLILSTAEVPYRTLEATLAARGFGAMTIVLTTGGDARYDQYSPLIWRLAPPADPITGPSLLLSMAYRLGLALGVLNGVAAARLAQLNASLEAMPLELERALQAAPDVVDSLAVRLDGARTIVVAGNGAAYAAATVSAHWFGAILARPVAVCGLEALSEFSHDPSVASLIIVPNGLSVRRAQHILEQIGSDSATALVVAQDSPLRAKNTGSVIPLPAMIERLSALVYLSAGQRIAIALAKRRQQ